MQWNFEDIHKQVRAEAEKIDSLQALEFFRLKYLGKKGLVAEVFGCCEPELGDRGRGDADDGDGEG